MRIEVYAQDEDIHRSMEECRNLAELDFAEPSSAEGRYRVLSVLDARDFEANRLRALLAIPEAFGDMVLVLVEASDKITAAFPDSASPGKIDFLVWPTSPLVLATRLQLLHRYLLAPRNPNIPHSDTERSYVGSFHAAIEWLPIMILSSEATGHDVFLNNALRRFLGAKTQHMTQVDFQESIDPKDKARSIVEIERAIIEHRTFEFTRHMRRFDNQWRLVRIIGRPHYDRDGSFAGLVESVMDITEQKQAEDLLLESMHSFQELADMVPLIIWQFDPQGGITLGNKRWHTYTGLPRRHLVLGEWLTIVHPADREAVAKASEEALRTGTSLRMDTRFREAAREIINGIHILPSRFEMARAKLQNGSAPP